MLLLNEVVVEEIGEVDIGEVGARAVFQEAFSALASAGLIVAEHFDADAPSVSYTEMGIGDNESAPEVVTTEYIFSLLRNVNGISFANAGVKISVHRSGKLAWLRLGGAEIRSELQNGIEVPLGEGYEFAQEVDIESINTRFAGEATGSDVIWQQLMYVLPDDIPAQVIEPRYTVAFNQTFIVDSEPMKSRMQLWSYSIRDETANAIDLMPADPGASGDQR